MAQKIYINEEILLVILTEISCMDECSILCSIPLNTLTQNCHMEICQIWCPRSGLWEIGWPVFVQGQTSCMSEHLVMFCVCYCRNGLLGWWCMKFMPQMRIRGWTEKSGTASCRLEQEIGTGRTSILMQWTEWSPLQLNWTERNKPCTVWVFLSNQTQFKIKDHWKQQKTFKNDAITIEISVLVCSWLWWRMTSGSPSHMRPCSHCRWLCLTSTTMNLFFLNLR